jgi:porin
MQMPRPLSVCIAPLHLSWIVLTIGLIARVPHAHAQRNGDTDLWHQDYLTGNWGGVRDKLSDDGINFTITYTGEVFGLVKGGIKQGATYDGQFLPQIDVNLDKLMGWQGASFRASMLQGSGPALTNGWVGNLMGVSGVVAIPPATRLYNLWLQQNLFGGVLSVRAGIENVDAEFMTTLTGSLFMNTTFGWPEWNSADLPGGGPAYPLSAPVVRVQLNPGPPGLYVQAAVFSGDPTGHDGSNSPNVSIPSGTVVSFNGGAFVIAEAGYAINQDKGAKGPPLAYKLGGWYHTSDQFQDQEFASNGVSLASPASSGTPLNHHGDWGIYGSADAVLYQTPGGNNLSGFLRMAGSPADRNLISFYLDGGLTYPSVIPGRDNDTMGIAVGLAQISPSAAALDQATQAFTGNPAFPVRTHEVVMELTYQAQIAPWFSVQPDVQYIFNPDGGVLNPNGSPRRDALVLGLRSAITF